jgi:tRNA-dihydrouridine synthase
VKKSVSIQVIGNGDVKNSEDIKEMLKICDYCMIGRAARDNPMTFSGKEIDRIKVFEDYVKLEKNFKLIKDRACDWTKDIRHGARIRDKIRRCKTLKELKREFLVISSK